MAYFQVNVLSPQYPNKPARLIETFTVDAITEIDARIKSERKIDSQELAHNAEIPQRWSDLGYSLDIKRLN